MAARFVPQSVYEGASPTAGSVTQSRDKAALDSVQVAHFSGTELARGLPERTEMTALCWVGDTFFRGGLFLHRFAVQYFHVKTGGKGLK